MVDQGSVPPETSSHQQGLDLEGKEDVVGGEGEDTRLARAFLMGTSRDCLRRGKLCFMPNVSFTKILSPRFASPKVGRIKTVNKASEWSFHIVYSSQALA